MSQDLLETAKAAVAAAQRRGAQEVRASAHRSRERVVEWRDGKLDRLRESTEMGLSVTLFVDGRYSSSATSDLRSEAIERFLDDAVAMTRVLAPDPHRRLPDSSRYANRHEGELETFDSRGSAEMNVLEHRRIAAALEAAARGAPGAEKILSVMATSSDTAGESALVNSNGMEGTRRGTTFNLHVWTTVRDAGDRKPGGGWYAGCRQRADLPTLDSVGREATRRALSGIGEKPEKSGQYPCVIENAVVGRLLRGLLEPLNGRAIQQRRSFLTGKLGQAVAAPALTLTDEPHLPRGLSSRVYDPEGMSTARRSIFERGVLRGLYLDTYYASKLKLQPTGGDSANLVLAPGKRDLAGLLRAMGRGILVTGFSGGNSNPATGDFSIGVRGQWIENGRPVRPLAEMNLSGNHLDFWKRLRELGSDVYRYSSLLSPSLRFDNVQFSGV